MQVATWNVNSIRSRLEHVLDWLTQNPVDVLCLQETKVIDAEFPRLPLEASGYFIYTSGQKSYNGVALLSREPLKEVSCGFAPIFSAQGGASDEVSLFDEQKRVITGITASGVRILNLYVPNGSSVGSEKYDYKLRWLQILSSYLKILQTGNPLSILMCGDFNIALEDRDIYDPKNKEQHIMSSPIEREALKAVLSLGFADAFRKFTQEEGYYSWWDYRTAAFRRNMGWRIDHHYLSPDLYEKAVSCIIDKTPRSLEKPSDHTPVIVELAL
jgi:exodeoxyribonuclease III